MRLIWFLSPALFVMALAFWAYQENYRTKEAYDQVAQMRDEIAQTRAELTMLRAEWAYLNRPDRLSMLADMHFKQLRLLPMHAEQFADLVALPYPPIKEEIFDASVDVAFDGRQP